MNWDNPTSTTPGLFPAPWLVSLPSQPGVRPEDRVQPGQLGASGSLQGNSRVKGLEMESGGGDPTERPQRVQGLTCFSRDSLPRS